MDSSDTFTLINGDCLAVLKGMPSESVAAVITDPPYGMNYQSNAREIKLDKIANDERPFIWFLYDAYRLTKNGGSILCFSDWKNQETWRIAIELAGYQIKSHVIWDRDGNGMGDLTGAFGPNHDIIWFATKGDFKFPSMRRPDTIKIKKVSSDKIIHPNQKPVSLMRLLIECVTKPGDIVLDPFTGSGSTGVAAVKSSRVFWGCELDKKYWSMATKRIKESFLQPDMFSLNSEEEQRGEE